MDKLNIDNVNERQEHIFHDSDHGELFLVSVHAIVPGSGYGGLAVRLVTQDITTAARVVPLLYVTEEEGVGEASMVIQKALPATITLVAEPVNGSYYTLQAYCRRMDE